jgi:uncharacterized membrane protein
MCVTTQGSLRDAGYSIGQGWLRVRLVQVPSGWLCLFSLTLSTVGIGFAASCADSVGLPLGSAGQQQTPLLLQVGWRGHQMDQRMISRLAGTAMNALDVAGRVGRWQRQHM